jgi:hypothetical protein
MDMQTQLLRVSATSLAAIILTGCAAMGPKFTQAPAPNTDSALVYIYRNNSLAWGGRDAYFYVDDINIADLSRNGYTFFKVKPGVHKLKQKWPIDLTLGLKKLELSAQWEAGKTYYYEFSTDAMANKIYWTLQLTAESDAIGSIQATRLQPAFGQEKLAAFLDEAPK